MNNIINTVNDKVLQKDVLDKISKRLDYGKVQKIIDERERYYNESTVDNQTKILGEIGIRVYKAYLPVISERYEPINNCLDDYKVELGMAFFDVTKWVHDSEEKGIDKLVNVYQTLSDQDCNIALIYDRDHTKTRVILAVANNSAVERSETIKLVDRIAGALNGNFPGVEFNHIQNNRCSGYGIPECLKKENMDENLSVAAISAIPSEKSEHFISQSIEKLLDGVVPRENDKYTLVLLGRPNRFVEDEKLELYNLYSQLSPLAEEQKNTTYNISASMTNSDTISVSKGFGHHVGANFIVGFGVNSNFGVSYAKTVSETLTTGKSDGTTRTYTNYGIKHTMENIEMQVKRMEESSALGLWDFSAYVYSTDPKLTQNVAYSYLSLIQGDKSFLGTDAVNYWDGSNKDDVELILGSLRKLRHPFFVLKDSIVRKDRNWLMYPPHVECTMSLSGKELAYAMNFPRKSVSGLPVYESASFGRDVQHYDSLKKGTKVVDIGNIVHMRHEESNRVELDLDSLTSHAFVTGSTGAGKTNTILELLSKSKSQGVKFLVIEPAKGEYKSYIGGICHVYGTNPRFFELLRMNPFSFPPNIHVLEHIDRLVEILNACWPMYAAMPAVLKDAIERSYIVNGWDLNGFNYIPDRFPTFADLLETLPQVMEESVYSGDTKSDYAGALLTRVKSLTNGINGQILCSKDEIRAESLFDENVIVDLSRVSSTETKALIMGILVMKLQEHKINLGEEAFTKELKHLTVLEEAHNLLRRTSIEQSQEGVNLQGKSVEMITNAIAEMRAYGEGFIIVDQSPGLLDEAVIRNTNTKIILRLPDIDDRKLVGKAEALKDIQIEELAKLPMGVAAVYQNDWVEAVLCKFDEFTEYNPMEKQIVIGNPQEDNSLIIQKFLKNIFSDIKEPLDEKEIECIKKWIESPRFSDVTKRGLREALKTGESNEESRLLIAYNTFEGKKIAKSLIDSYSEEEGLKKADDLIRNVVNISDENLINVIRNNIINALCIQNNEGEIARRYERGDGLWRSLQ